MNTLLDSQVDRSLYSHPVPRRLALLAALIGIPGAAGCRQEAPPAPPPLGAQTMNDADLGRRVRELEDRAALKALVDTFSILADHKDVRAQTQLFTEDATTEAYRGGARVSQLRGRAEMGAAFGAFLANFETVHHFNGQQTVTIDGDRASETSYCLVTLIGDEGGRTMQTTIGVIYNDEYVREAGRWLIARRRSVFDWEEKREVSR